MGQFGQSAPISNGLERASKAESHLAAIVQSADDAIITISPEMRVTSWNPAAERLFGFTREEAIGRRVVDLYVRTAERGRVEELIRQDFAALRHQPTNVRRVEDALQRKDGSLVEVSLVATGLFDSSGNSLGISVIIRDISQRKIAEREQALLAAIVSSSKSAIVSVSCDGRISTWNRSAENLLGFTASEAIGQPVSLYLPAEDRAAVEKRVAERMAHARDQRFEVQQIERTLCRKDGTSFRALMVMTGIYASQGEFVGLSAIITDITDRERAEREQALLAAIVNASEDAIISISSDNGIASWNRGAEQLFGVDAREALGQKILEFVPEEERERVQAAIGELWRSGKPASFKLHSRRKNGTSRISWLSLFPTYDANGRIATIGAIGRDITDLARLEQEQSLLGTIVDASQEAIVAVSREMRITSWNRGAERVYGHALKEAIGQGFEFFLPPEDVPAAIAATKTVLETGEHISWEQRAPQKDGSTIILMVNIYPIRDQTGEIVAVAGIGYDITRLKHTEAELREAQEYTRGLIESSVDAMVIVNPDLRISDSNARLAQLTELPKKSLFGSPFDGYFTESPRAREAIEKVLKDGHVTNVDLTLRTASGKEIPVSFNASLFYRAGKVFGIFGVARDVTEQRAMERKLRAEREYSRSLIQSSPDALLVSDSSLTLTDVNEQALALTSYAREELIGSKLISLFTEPMRAAEVIEKLREEGLARDIELLMLTKNAREIPISLNASAFSDGDGSEPRIVVAVRDISAARRAQQANSLLASIVDASGDAIISETIDMIITSWNPAAEKLFGYAAAEVVGRSSALTVPLDRRNEVVERNRRIERTGKAERIETTRLRKDGSSVGVAITRAPILDSSGAVTAFSVTVTDISERLRMEAELTKARDAAVEAGRIKSEFLANMSHEIRTPLNSIIGLTGLLLDTALDTEQRNLARDVHESGDLLLNLVNDILDFSKIAAGKLTFEEVDFNLTDVVESAVGLVAENARQKRLELTVSVEPDVPRLLRGDPSRLRQVLMNLLSNAVKFSERGEVAAAVNKLDENPCEAVLRFEVRDTGIGIPQEKQHLLFQAFTQLDASTSRHYGGTGLGLSIASKLVEGMRGTIALSSTPGVGSTFWFTARFAKQIDTGRPASERFASLSGTKILIVDDNANSQQILERQVTAWGMEPRTASSAEEALVIMRRDKYEIALVDVMMRNVDGIELARQMNADPALAAVVIVFVSSVGSRSDFASRLSGLQYRDWLMKPVPESLLCNALTKALSSRPGITGIVEPLPQASAAGERPVSARKITLPAGRELIALLAEDNPINQKVAKMQLAKVGCRVDTVSNGRDAVEAVARQPYDVVFMDCQMPEMDGYEAAREIRWQESPGRHTVIVAMTAHALPGDRDKCLAAGMDSYISKPVKQAVLEATLAELFPAKPSEPTSAAGE
jgi:two-component system, sensor histidine kinase and response regulator